MIDWNDGRSTRISGEQQIRQLAIMEATTDLVATVDVDGFVIKMNQGGYDLLGLSENIELSRIRFASFYSKEQALELLSIAIPGAIAKGTWHSETNLLSSDGEEIPCSQVLIAHKDSSDNIQYFSLILRDVRPIKAAEKERKSLLEQLHQAKKMETVGRMAGGVAHDFNNIITVIMGYAEIGLVNLSSGDNAAKNELEIILDTAHKAARLSSQLLEFSSKKRIEPQVLELNEVIEDSRQLIESLMSDEVELDIRLGSSLWSIKFDCSQLEQVLLNLALNAKDAITANGKFSIVSENIVLSFVEVINLGLSDQCEYVKLTVSDTGCGIDPGVLEYIYDPFFTTKDTGKGTGLGLSTVFTAIKQNKGQIVVNSVVGEGTSFVIYLPRTREGEVKTVLDCLLS